jgi:3-methyladenine DNA glycosylase AlkD
MTAAEIISELRRRGSPTDVEGQRRFGITPRIEQLGVRMELLRDIARAHRRQHALALELWESRIYDARQLAALVNDPKQVTREQMEAWVLEFDNWATCDNACIHLFRKTPHAFACARAWVRREEEFVKRAGFAMLATLTVEAKKEPDESFLAFLPEIRRASGDSRNFVKKAVNWALRQIGKRNPACRLAAIAEAKHILSLDTPSARWIARDALRELEKV